MKNNEKFSYIIRIIAGVYLIYLSIPLLRGVANGTITSNRGIMVGAAIFFLIVSVFFIGNSVWALYKKNRVIEKKDIEKENMIEASQEDKKNEKNE